MLPMDRLVFLAVAELQRMFKPKLLQDSLWIDFVADGDGREPCNFSQLRCKGILNTSLGNLPDVATTATKTDVSRTGAFDHAIPTIDVADASTQNGQDGLWDIGRRSV